jgi:hypothetical protein
MSEVFHFGLTKPGVSDSTAPGKILGTECPRILPAFTGAQRLEVRWIKATHRRQYVPFHARNNAFFSFSITQIPHATASVFFRCRKPPGLWPADRLPAVQLKRVRLHRWLPKHGPQARTLAVAVRLRRLEKDSRPWGPPGR